MFSRYSNFFIFIPSFPVFKFKRTNENGIIDDFMNWLAKINNVIFAATEKPLYVTSSNLAR